MSNAVNTLRPPPRAKLIAVPRLSEVTDDGEDEATSIDPQRLPPPRPVSGELVSVARPKQSDVRALLTRHPLPPRPVARAATPATSEPIATTPVLEVLADSELVEEVDAVDEVTAREAVSGVVDALDRLAPKCPASLAVANVNAAADVVAPAPEPTSAAPGSGRSRPAHLGRVVVVFVTTAVFFLAYAILAAGHAMRGASIELKIRVLRALARLGREWQRASKRTAQLYPERGTARQD
jgi:hypothetical protein